MKFFKCFLVRYSKVILVYMRYNLNLIKIAEKNILFSIQILFDTLISS